MADLTKKECLQFEKIAEYEITKVIGVPEVGVLGNATWQFPYGDGGTVTINLIRSKKKISERGYLPPWIACRYHNPSNRGRDGYTLPIREINWPSGHFTYPSGKCNLHIRKEDNFAFELATHLLRISKPETKYWESFGDIKFEISQTA